MPEPGFHPELAWSADALILLALRDQLLADPALAAVLKGIVFAEMTEAVTQDSIALPMLALSLLADEERDFRSSYGAALEVVVRAVLLTQVPEEFGSTEDFFRSRLVARIRRVVRAGFGVLTREGRRLTEAVTRIRRVNFDRTPLANAVLVTAIDIVYESRIHLITQEIIE